MAYVKQTWSCGDDISADKLNHMEDGIFSANSGGALVVRAQSFVKENGVATLTFDKTWQQVHDAIANGIPCYLGSVTLRWDSLCEIDSFNDRPMLVPIYEAYEEPLGEEEEADAQYVIVVVDGYDGIDTQTSPDTLMVNSSSCD